MKKFQKYLQIFIVLILIIGYLGPATASMDRNLDRIHPLLIQIATETPNERVSVIVQKLDPSKQAEDMVLHLGGEVTKDLSIINAFAAELPAKSVPVLASMASVKWVSPDAVMQETKCRDCDKNKTDETTWVNSYIQTIGADRVDYDALDGETVAVAVVDSGIKYQNDFDTHRGHSRVITSFPYPNSDSFGHGTHIAGIIGGNGEKSDGAYRGVAPFLNLVDVKVANSKGAATTSDVVEGLQWIYENKDTYNIRVVNISLTGSVVESYTTSPLDAALEILWFNGVVVVVSAGNSGSGEDNEDNGILYPPANDPFVITVGATDENGTEGISDDTVASFSASGLTSDGFSKPDIVAPGKNIVSVLAQWKCVLAKEHPDNVVNRYYFRMSGTSVAAPMVSGAAALLLQVYPDLTPDQVKDRLMATANKEDWDYHATEAGAGYLDVDEAIYGDIPEPANQENILPNDLLAKMALIAYWANQNGGENIDWENVDWSSVNWSSVNWSSVNWSSVNWSSVNWSSVDWSKVTWGSVNWSSVNWSSVNWSSVNWSSVNWSSVNWSSVNWSSDYWED
jgi:serine protease AprX